MSVEEDRATEGDVFSGFLDDFGSGIGSTLEDLVSDWNEGDYEKQDVENFPKATIIVEKTRPSFKTRLSMEKLEGMTDWSLMKARPLAFANPVYDLVNMGGVVTRSRQMTLIPLSQFEINKPDSGKQGKHKPHKRGSHGLINKISNTIRKHHSMRKQEQEMNVTAPLWTDVPSAVYNDPTKRSTSLKKSSNENLEKIDSSDKERSSSLGVVQIDERLKLQPADDDRESDEPSKTKSSPVRTGSLELPSNKRLKNADSNSSISSDVSEDLVEEERPSKTMMEVMNEINDDSAIDEDMNQQKIDDTANTENVNQQKFDENGEVLLLKRNKTLKWSGSRTAPALIREFTRKSKKVHNRQEAPVQSDSSETAQTQTKPTQSAEVATEQTQIKKTQLTKVQGNQTKSESPGRTAQKIRDSSAFTVLSCLLPPAPKLRRTESTKIRTYISRMGTNTQNPLGYATTEFVRQTMNSKEQRPIVLLHTVRSFQTDIKRYMISNPHLPFMVKILRIVKNAAIIDIEGAIDDALERLILYPLRDFIYKRLVRDYARSGKISVVEDAIKVGKTKTLRELGIRPTLIPPADDAMDTIREHFSELQMTFSPYYKLKHLLSAVTTIYENTTDLTCEDKSARKIGADDFLPLLVHSIITCDFTAADIEAQYIDGLLDPTLLLGEGGYYLTTLISAVQVLSSMKTPLPNIADLQGFLKVGISSKSENSSEKTNDTEDEETLLMHKTLHVPPSMTSHNLGLMIAKKYGIKDTKNYCLHVVVNGVAYPLKPQEFPQLVKMDLLTQFQSSSFFFVYRQIAKTPEKTDDRPTTMDSEHLKVNTEGGQEVEITAQGVKEDLKDSSEDSGRDEDQLDNLPLPIDVEEIPDGIRSPGFAEIPLPDSVVFNMEATASKEEATYPHPDQDVPLPLPEVTTSQDATFPLPEVTTSQEATLPLPDATIVTDDEVEHLDLSESLPLPDEILLESEEQIPALDSTLTPQDTTMVQLEDDLPLPDDIPSPVDTDVSINLEEIEPPDLEETNPGTFALSENDVSFLDAPPVTSVEVTPSVQVKISSVDPDLDTLPPPPGIEDPTSLSADDFSNSAALDTSDADLTSDEDVLMDETYYPAALVDDELSPAKGRKKNLQKKSIPPFPASPQKVIKEEDTYSENVDSSSTETASDGISMDESFLESSKIDEDPSASPGVPCVTFTDLSRDHETLSESVLSDVSSVSDGNYGNNEGRMSSRGYHSDGRRSAGSQGDGNYGNEPGKGYHSDGHYADDNIPIETDIGAHTSVSTLKSYFESEITKVAQDLAKTVSHHSPK